MLAPAHAYAGAVRQRVVIVNGPAGVGKTTIGRLLARRAPNGVCIHGDGLAKFIVTRVEGAVETGLGYVNGATIAANFIRAGYDLVVFEYCLESAAHVRRFLDAYDAAAPVSLLTLWAPLDVVVERERERVGRTPLRERVEAGYRAMESSLGELGHIVQNVGPPEDVAALLDELSSS
jgi:chloramphenicol 3-O-phosphotransferase